MPSIYFHAFRRVYRLSIKLGTYRSINDHAPDVSRVYDSHEFLPLLRKQYKFLHAFEAPDPESCAQPGSLQYGSSHRIIDCIEIRTCIVGN